MAALAAAVQELPGRLLQLKAVFPGANVAVLAMRQPELVLGFDMGRLESIAAELRELLPKLNIGACWVWWLVESLVSIVLEKAAAFGGVWSASSAPAARAPPFPCSPTT